MIVHLHNCSEKELVFTGNGNIFTLPVKYVEDYGHETNPFDEEFKFPKNFPFCCDHHIKIYDHLTSWYNKFPNCCPYHESLAQNIWFYKNKYKYIVVRILKNFKYSENYIEKHAHSEDNLKDCRDYIDYCYYSFGIHGVGTDRFLGLLKRNIPIFKIPQKSKNNLIEHCNSYSSNRAPQSDMNFITINDMFQKWTDSIPNLDSFKEIKKSLSNIVPLNLFARDKRHNKFTGRTSFLLKTQSEFVNDLTQLTKNILSQYSNDKGTKDVDLFKANHKTKQDKLLDKYSKQELNYVNILSEWLENEIELIKNLKSLEMAKVNITGSNPQVFINEAGTQINNIGVNTEAINDLIAAVRKENYNIDNKSVEELENEVQKSKPDKSKLKSLFSKIATELTTKVGVELLKPEIIALIKDLQTVF